jgi:hypothetical protein
MKTVSTLSILHEERKQQPSFLFFFESDCDFMMKKHQEVAKQLLLFRVSLTLLQQHQKNE